MLGLEVAGMVGAMSQLWGGRHNSVQGQQLESPVCFSVENVRAVGMAKLKSPFGNLLWGQNYECCRAWHDIVIMYKCISPHFKKNWYNAFDKPQKLLRDFPHCTVVKNLPSNAGVLVLIPCQGTKVPYTLGQLSRQAMTTELAPHN